MKTSLSISFLMVVLLSGCIAGPTPHPGDDTGKFNGFNTSPPTASDAGVSPTCDYDDPASQEECLLEQGSTDDSDIHTSSDVDDSDGDAGPTDGEIEGDGTGTGSADGELEEIAADE